MVQHVHGRDSNIRVLPQVTQQLCMAEVLKLRIKVKEPIRCFEQMRSSNRPHLASHLAPAGKALNKRPSNQNAEVVLLFTLIEMLS